MYSKSDVKKAIKGNKKAFEKIIEFEKDRLYRIAYLYVKNENDAVEIVQQTAYKAFISIDKLKKPEQSSAWLKRIAINNSIDFLRQQKKVTPFIKETLEAIPAKEINIDDKMDLYQLIDQLDERQKTIIILKYYEDLPNHEIAKIIGCPEGTVKSSLHRTLLMLRRKMEGGCINE
ncbi:sigma-70 family RNA polymerase sigma factor [Aquibacillus rhizosphaerae]|uniref:Sigma-70 family RNA polymerase sigma factor n=1 Tax=Aquibacillus rhizosphaerae TaxID=3051431 RepID=A0ABT7LA62_9BACI|nr:sigma-70 family RNA polymerase sigma factor [Aquibacillus sp. LR5S19]MDL4842075.1 sigma-70 family RNA polymerase sigma factor [Aquibacillus sp. LR5S19]